MEFNEFSSTELIECIKDYDVSIENEDIVIDSVVYWVQHDLYTRKSSFQKAFEHVPCHFVGTTTCGTRMTPVTH